MSGKPRQVDRLRCAIQADGRFHLDGNCGSFTGTTALSTTLDGLDSKGKSYEVQVRAGNDEGDSDMVGKRRRHNGGRGSSTAVHPQHRRELGSGNGHGRPGHGHIQHQFQLHPTPTALERNGRRDSFDIDSSTGQIKVKSGNHPELRSPRLPTAVDGNRLRWPRSRRAQARAELHPRPQRSGRLHRPRDD